MILAIGGIGNEAQGVLTAGRTGAVKEVDSAEDGAATGRRVPRDPNED